MLESSLEKAAEAIRESWSAETCDPADLDRWTAANPARGQCGVTALVLHDLFGGDLMLAEVLMAGGVRQGFHYWNVLPGGQEVDLTLEQFDQGEAVQPGHRVIRPPGPPGRCEEQYTRLRARVLARLAG
jgi:hypothetical protein